MKLGDTFAPWLQQPLDPPPVIVPETAPTPDPEPVRGRQSTSNSDPVPFHADGRARDSAENTAWLCPHCDYPVTITDVFPAADGSGLLTLWQCTPCEAVGLTPAALKAPPPDFVTKLKSNNTQLFTAKKEKKMALEEKIEIQLSDRSYLHITASEGGLVRVMVFVPGVGQDGKETMSIRGSSILSAPTLRALKKMFDKGTYISS